ncbi:DUF2179 domain-containing protein [Saccharicrinis sp. FJH2]|uniref:DUF2179 domain-containing protein n=1 Tax=unclassified Saccharicrinis TaxID=2646859 RepID=UPI0035D4BF49
MSDLISTDSFMYTYILIPLLIFLARIADQSIGTLRIIFVSKGFKAIGPMLGFFEVIIWLLAMGQIMQHLNNVWCYLAYGGGFATGNYIGMLLEERLSLGTVLVRIIPKKDTTKLIENLKNEKFGVTYLDAKGGKGPVNIILTIVKRKQLPRVINIINEHNPNAFYTIEELKTVNEGVIPLETNKTIFKRLTQSRKNK